MALLDAVETVEWDQASQRLALRQLMFEHAANAFPKNHELYKHAEKELQKARVALDEIIARAMG